MKLRRFLLYTEDIHCATNTFFTWKDQIFKQAIHAVFTVAFHAKSIHCATGTFFTWKHQMLKHDSLQILTVVLYTKSIHRATDRLSTWKNHVILTVFTIVSYCLIYKQYSSCH